MTLFRARHAGLVRKQIASGVPKALLAKSREAAAQFTGTGCWRIRPICFARPAARFASRVGAPRFRPCAAFDNASGARGVGTSVASTDVDGGLVMVCEDDYERAAGWFALRCAWCRGVVGGSRAQDSHGICEACRRRELEAWRASGGEPDGLPTVVSGEGAASDAFHCRAEE
jgi:hypothetical protein